MNRNMDRIGESELRNFGVCGFKLKFEFLNVRTVFSGSYNIQLPCTSRECLFPKTSVFSNINISWYNSTLFLSSLITTCIHEQRWFGAICSKWGDRRALDGIRELLLRVCGNDGWTKTANVFVIVISTQECVRSPNLQLPFLQVSCVWKPFDSREETVRAWRNVATFYRRDIW